MPRAVPKRVREESALDSARVYVVRVKYRRRELLEVRRGERRPGPWTAWREWEYKDTFYGGALDMRTASIWARKALVRELKLRPSRGRLQMTVESVTLVERVSSP